MGEGEKHRKDMAKKRMLKFKYCLPRPPIFTTSVEPDNQDENSVYFVWL